MVSSETVKKALTETPQTIKRLKRVLGMDGSNLRRTLVALWEGGDCERVELTHGPYRRKGGRGGSPARYGWKKKHL
jgi:hypothetical protein